MRCGCALSEPSIFANCSGRARAESNKGTYGHVLVIAGGRGKSGAAALAGIAALRAGAGLSTVASAESAISAIASHAPEIMTEPLPETASGSISSRALEHDWLPRILENKDVIALGPGLGHDPETVQFIRRVVAEQRVPMVVDADGLNALGRENVRCHGPRIFTPHPGEMSRLTGSAIRRDSSRSHRGRARVRHRARRLSGAQRQPHRRSPRPTAGSGSIPPARPPWRPAEPATCSPA